MSSGTHLLGFVSMLGYARAVDYILQWCQTNQRISTTFFSAVECGARDLFPRAPKWGLLSWLEFSCGCCLYKPLYNNDARQVCPSLYFNCWEGYLKIYLRGSARVMRAGKTNPSLPKVETIQNAYRWGSYVQTCPCISDKVLGSYESDGFLEAEAEHRSQTCFTLWKLKKLCIVRSESESWRKQVPTILEALLSFSAGTCEHSPKRHCLFSVSGWNKA